MNHSMTQEELGSLVDFHLKLEQEHQKALLKLKTIERTHEKELLELRILYQSQKEKTELLEQTMKSYPSVNKYKHNQNKLKQTQSHIKIMKATIDELTSSHSDELMVRRLEKELKSFKESTIQELKEREQANQALSTELQRFRKAFEQLQIEYKSVRGRFALQKQEKEDLLDSKKILENELFESKTALADLQKSILTRIQEARSLEAEHFTLALEAQNARMRQLDTELQDSLRDVQRMEQIVLQTKASKLQIAYEMDRSAKVIQQLESQNQFLHSSRGQTVTTENEDTSQSLQEVNEEKETLRRQMTVVEESFKRRASELHVQKAGIQEEVMNLRQQLSTAQTEVKKYYDRSEKYKAMIAELEARAKKRQEDMEQSIAQTKQNSNETIAKLRAERDELRKTVEDMQTQIDVTRNSILIPGFSLLDELNNVKENEVVSTYYETVDASKKTIESLNVEIFERDFKIKTLTKQKEELEVECNSLYKKLITGERPSLFKERVSDVNVGVEKYLDSEESSLIFNEGERSVRPSAAGFELESERDMLQAEVHRLQTQLRLSMQEWAVYNNQIREDLEKEQTMVVKLSMQLQKMGEMRAAPQTEPRKKKFGWFKRKLKSGAQTER